MVRTSEQNLAIVQRLRWYIWVRWFLLSAITLPSLATLYVGTGLVSIRQSNAIFTVVLFATNGVFYALGRLQRSPTYYRVLGICLVGLDISLVSYFIYSLGGIESRSPILYTMPILMSAAMFGRRGVYLAASASAFIYDFIIVGNYYGWLHSPQALTAQAANGTYVVNTIIFFTIVLLLVAVLTDFLTRLLIQKEFEARSVAADLHRAQAIAKLGSWEWDFTTDRTTWSDELYDMFGITRTRQGGNYQGYISRVHPDDRKWTSNTIGRAIKTHQPFSFEHRIVRPDKTVHIIRTAGKVLANKHGKVHQLYGIMQDITAERALEVAKGDFVSLASHQLRTPASGVRMLLAMLRDGYSGQLSHDQKVMVEQAYEANQRLLHIADDLLNVAKVESGRMVLNKRQVELVAWLKTMFVQQKLLAKERQLKLKLNVPKAAVYVLADSERLVMVVDNLLSNARKYTPARGTITVRLQPTQRNCNIIVKDTGSGMTKTEITRLFGKFTRLDNPASKGAEGTGLGLYLAKSIVDMHGGSIRVQSRPGIGSTFTVRLPRRG